MRFLFLVAILFILLLACSDKSNQHKKDCCGNYCDSIHLNACPEEFSSINKIDLDTIFFRINQESYSNVSMAEALRSKSFKYLYDHPMAYQEEILSYLPDSSKLLTYRAWAIESQSACDDNYYQFSKKVIELFKQEKIEKRLLFHLLNPLVNRNFPFIRNYQNKRFKNLLEQLKSLPKTPKDIKEFIDDIQSGYVCKHIELYQ